MAGESIYSKEEIKRAYSRVAWFYDVWGGLTESRAHERELELASIKNGEAMLEVAVGTGALFERIVRLNPDGRNEGLDLSESMLNKARRRLEGKGSFNLVIRDAYELPYEDDTFDVLINNYMLDLLPKDDYPHILGEFNRVLKPGGRLLIASMTNGREWYSRVWDIIARMAPVLLTGCRPVNLEATIRDAGFAVENVEYLTQNTFPSLVMLGRKS